MALESHVTAKATASGRRIGLWLALALPAPALLASAPAGAEVPLPEPRPTAAPATIAPSPAKSDLDRKPAKELFGARKLPAALNPRSIGFYAKGCLAGAAPLSIDGPAWQAMRLSRNRTWGHPSLIGTLEKLAARVKTETKWPGLLVGDISQPRGGPMLTGHASHQIGLDADIWLNPMPNRRYSAREREDISARSVANAKFTDVGKEWTPEHIKVIRAAATMPGVERVLVNPVIKKALCREAKGDRSWLAKVRPYWGHHYHMHIRMVCPKDSPNCRPQDPVPADDGCGAPLDWWLKQVKVPDVPPPPPKVPPKPKPPMTMAALPDECRSVLLAPDAGTAQALTPAPTGQDTPVPPMPQ